MIRIGAVVSIEVTALRGITAGSGTATTEMKVVLIRIVDAAFIAHPTVIFTVYVDDISAEMTGPDDHIAKELGDAVMEVGQALEANQQELLGRVLAHRWSPLSVIYKRRVKSLGLDLAGGRRRTTQVQADRLRRFKMRIPQI